MEVEKNTIHCRERCLISLCVCAEGVMAPIKQWVRRSGRIFTPRSELWILHVSDFVWGLKCVIIFQLYHERHPQLLAAQDMNCCVLEFFHLWQISNNLVTFYLWVWTGCLSPLISSECFFSVCLDTSCSALVTEGCRWGLTGHQIETQERRGHRRFDEHLQ